MVDSAPSHRRGSTQSDTSALVSSLTRDPSQSPSGISTTGNTLDLSPSPSCSSLHIDVRSEGSLTSPPETPKRDYEVYYPPPLSKITPPKQANPIKTPRHASITNLKRFFFLLPISRLVRSTRGSWESKEDVAGSNANQPGNVEKQSFQHRLVG